MKTKHCPSSVIHQSGGMLTELLLTLSIVAVMMPFLVNYHSDRIARAENIAVANDMDAIQIALERYMESHTRQLLTPIGKNITRVKIGDLVEFGAPDTIVEKYGDKFQARILKSAANTLQGIVVLNDREITPLRTREIVNLGGGRMGFVDGANAFGGYGTWRSNTGDLGIGTNPGILDTTKTLTGITDYLWRTPSENTSDATMLSGLNLAGHDISGANAVDAQMIDLAETLKSGTVASDRMIFQSRTTIDNEFNATNATVAGTLSSDGRNMEISGTISLVATGKFSEFKADNLWTNNLNLSGLSVGTDGLATMKINQNLDMVGGHIVAMFATVGFAGSITPQLTINDRIEDSSNPSYYWTADGTANMNDISIAELSRMAILAASRQRDNTASYQIWNSVVINKNATASDFINAIDKIQHRVRAKYNALKLD